MWRKLDALCADLQEKARRDRWQTSRQALEILTSFAHRRIEYIVFARSLLTPLPTVEPRMPVTLRPACQSDLSKFKDLISSSELAYFERRLTYGRHCFVALDPANDNLAAYCWAATQVKFDVDKLEISLESGDAYVDDAYTIPAYRRQRIQTAVHLYRLRYMRNLGYHRAILIVEDTNTASQKLVRKLGYREVDQLSFRRILVKRTFHYHQGRF